MKIFKDKVDKDLTLIYIKENIGWVLVILFFLVIFYMYVKVNLDATVSEQFHANVVRVEITSRAGSKVYMPPYFVYLSTDEGGEIRAGSEMYFKNNTRVCVKKFVNKRGGVLRYKAYSSCAL